MDEKFPVLTMQLSDQSLSIRLADEHTSHQVSLPWAMVRDMQKMWESFLAQSEPRDKTFGRYYTGTWPQEDMLI